MGNNHVLRTTLYVFIWLILLMITAIFFIVGPRVEAVLFPPVRTMEFFEPYVEEDEQGRRHRMIRGFMEKPRGASCEPISIQLISYSIDDPDLVAKSIEIDFEPDFYHNQQDRPGPNTFVARTRGIQDFGPWEIIPREPPVGPVAKIVTVHECHPLWTVETTPWTGMTSELFPGLYDPSTGELLDDVSSWKELEEQPQGCSPESCNLRRDGNFNHSD